MYPTFFLDLYKEAIVRNPRKVGSLGVQVGFEEPRGLRIEEPRGLRRIFVRRKSAVRNACCLISRGFRGLRV